MEAEGETGPPVVVEEDVPEIPGDEDAAAPLPEIGAEVEARGLTGDAKKLNGKMGAVKAHQKEKGRAVVEFYGGEGKKSVCAKNLRLSDDDEPAPKPPVKPASKGTLPAPPQAKASPAKVPQITAESEDDDSATTSSEESEEHEEGAQCGALVLHDPTYKMGKGGVEAVVMRHSEDENMGYDFDDDLCLRSVVPDSPAQTAGLGRLLGMKLMHVNGEPVKSWDDIPEDFFECTAVVLGLVPNNMCPPIAAKVAAPDGMVGGGQLVLAEKKEKEWRPPGCPANLPPVLWDPNMEPLPIKLPEFKAPPLARVPQALSGRFAHMPTWNAEDNMIVPIVVAGGVAGQKTAPPKPPRPMYMNGKPEVRGQYSCKKPRESLEDYAAQEEEKQQIKWQATAPGRSGGQTEILGQEGAPMSATSPGGQLSFNPDMEVPLPNNHEVLAFKPGVAGGEAPQPSAPHGKGPGWTPKPPPSMHPDRGLMFDPDRERGTAPGGSTCLSVGRRFHGKEGGDDTLQGRIDATENFIGQYTKDTWGETEDGQFVPGKTGETYVPGRGRQDGSGMGNATSARINSARPPPTSTPGEVLRFEEGCEMLSFGESLLDVHLTVPGTHAHDLNEKFMMMKASGLTGGMGGGGDDSDDEDLDPRLFPEGKEFLRHPVTGLPINNMDYHAVPNEVLQAKVVEKKDPLIINPECGDIGGHCAPPPALVGKIPQPPLTEPERNRLIQNFRARHSIPDEFEYALRGLDSEGLRSVLRPLLDAGRDPTTVLTARINLEKRRIKSDLLKLQGGNTIREHINAKMDPMLEEAPMSGQQLAVPCPCGGALLSFITDSAWLCSGCDEKFAKGTSGFYGCRTCDWDVCPKCARRLQAGVAACCAAVILAGRALEALADAWEQAKKHQKHGHKRSKKHDCSDAGPRRPGSAAVTADRMADLPYQIGDQVDVMRTDGSWTPGRIDEVKEAMSTLCYVVLLSGEGQLKKTVPCKKADGKLRPHRHSSRAGSRAGSMGGLSTGSGYTSGVTSMASAPGMSSSAASQGDSEAPDSKRPRYDSDY